ncbi:MAG TPA: hypothetical protein VLH39_08815 [Magnetospirillaceae bacterium]|nr:hypothetical protein [Magnetospirillaceae bacterium]
MGRLSRVSYPRFAAQTRAAQTRAAQTRAAQTRAAQTLTARTLAAVALAALALGLLASCANLKGPRAAHPPEPPAHASAYAPKALEEALKALPTSVRHFLAELRERVRLGDWSWAAERADAGFLRAMEGRTRDPYFFTYLFASGSLTADGPNTRFELLPMGRVRDMAWEDARIEGPVAVVRGRFLLTSGPPVPFALRVLWRFDPPRILGLQP